jgi:hypothetical protein
VFGAILGEKFYPQLKVALARVNLCGWVANSIPSGIHHLPERNGPSLAGAIPSSFVQDRIFTLNPVTTVRWRGRRPDATIAVVASPAVAETCVEQRGNKLRHAFGALTRGRHLLNMEAPSS